jgi:hypothetical protein
VSPSGGRGREPFKRWGAIALRSFLDPHQEFFRSLSPEEEQLLILRDFLYEGDWDEMLQDLNDRQSGKPFIFKLKSRIEEDLQRIERLREYERKHGIDLGKFVEPERLSDGSIDTVRDR